MKTKTVQLYPSPENFQMTNEDAVPFRAIAHMMAKIVAGLPEDERDGVMVTGWKSIRLVNPNHKVSEMEVLQGELARITNALKAASRDGLTPDELKTLLNGG